MYNFTDTTLNVPRTDSLIRPHVDRTQWNRLNEVFGEALVSETASAQLLAGDRALLDRYGVSGAIQIWINQVAAPTLDDLAQRILIEFGG